MHKELTVLILLIMMVFNVSGAGQQMKEEPFENRFGNMTWEEIVAEADGQDVYFYMWGGADHINKWVSGYFRNHLSTRFNINLEMVPVDGAPVYINKVLGEKQAGRNRGGAVDVMWINGENFRTMRQGELLFGPYAGRLPHIDFVNPDAMAFDFGYPVEGYESPYGAAQCVMEYDSARIDTPPRDIGALFEWARTNPGKLTYAAPPDFTGSVFVRHVFYHVAGGYEKLMGPFDEDIYNEIAPRVWKMLNDIEPYLWRKGETYPESTTRIEELLGNGEVYIKINYGPDGAPANIDKGFYPPTVKTYMFDSGMIGNINYVAISFNSDHKAAAMVMANELLNPEVQLSASRPISDEGMAWMTPLDPGRMPGRFKSDFESLPLHPSRLSSEILSSGSLPEIRADWLVRIEEDWHKEVLRK